MTVDEPEMSVKGAPAIRVKANYVHGLLSYRRGMLWLLLFIAGALTLGGVLMANGIGGGGAIAVASILPLLMPFDYVFDDRGISMEPRTALRPASDRELYVGWDEILSWSEFKCHGCNALKLNLKNGRTFEICSTLSGDQGIGFDAMQFILSKTQSSEWPWHSR